tara:strand:+ start:72 stop:626 length:555 start_codon:yes stop_codon:yes gene_type:complete
MWSPWWIWESNIPDTVCDQIIDCSNKIQYEKGGTEKDADGGNWRKVDVKFLYEEFNWINSLMYGYAMFANSQNFNYDLSLYDKEAPQLSHYKLGQYYGKHMDFNGSSEFVAYTRKLSMSIQLSDEKSYDGGDLILYYDEQKYPTPKSKGTIIVFDSRITHEVTPVIRGERYSLVKWIHGDKPLA